MHSELATAAEAAPAAAEAGIIGGSKVAAYNQRALIVEASIMRLIRNQQTR